MIIGFFHIGALGRWHKIYQSQFELLKSSGLYDKTDTIYIGISGQDITDFLLADDKIKIAHIDNKLENGEISTIKFLHKLCCQSEVNFKLWYIHTKGAHYTEKCKPHMIENVDSWREYLEYFIIQKHEQCEKLLENYDICGTEYSTDNFFSGNFWWANSNYVKKIDFKGEWLKGYTLGKWKSKRHLAERNFIGTAYPKVFNFMTIYKNSREAYFNKINKTQYVKQ